MMGQLYAITPFTMLDYPGELACIAWFSGCNLRCTYCHNPDIVLRRGQKEDSELVSFLESRRGLLTGVVFSGGEATFCSALPALARKAKDLGYKTKLDTNGTNPEMLHRLVEDRRLDAVALDYKGPPHRSEHLLGTSRYMAAFRESLAYLVEAARLDHIDLEIRTTCDADLLDRDDLAWMIEDLDRIGYRGDYWLQNIVATGGKTLGNIDPVRHVFDREKLPHPKNFKLGFRNFPEPPGGLAFAG